MWLSKTQVPSENALKSKFLLTCSSPQAASQLQSGGYTRARKGDNRVVVVLVELSTCSDTEHLLCIFSHQTLVFWERSGEERETQVSIFCVSMSTTQKIRWPLCRSCDCVSVIQHVKLFIWKGCFGPCRPEVKHCQAPTGLVWELWRFHLEYVCFK